MKCAVGTSPHLDRHITNPLISLMHIDGHWKAVCADDPSIQTTLNSKSHTPGRDPSQTLFKWGYNTATAAKHCPLLLHMHYTFNSNV